MLCAVGNSDVLDFGTCGGYCPRTDSFSIRAITTSIRLGIAWSHGNTVLRAGGGTYHTDGQEDDQNLPISNTVDRYAFSTAFGAFLSFDSFLTYAENGGFGSCISARPRSKPEGRLRCRLDRIRSAKLPLFIVGTASLPGQ